MHLFENNKGDSSVMQQNVSLMTQGTPDPDLVCCPQVVKK